MEECMSNQPERRADAAMIARVDERTEFLCEMAAEAKVWRESHTKQDDERHDAITKHIAAMNLADSNRRAVAKDRRMAFMALWAGMVFVGWDKLIGLFK
jgi:hypothetical protein